MAKKKLEEEHENHERWAVSYSDMMTVMMCLFLVLYAISQVDGGKLARLRASLAAGFNNNVVASSFSILDGGDGAMLGSSTAADTFERGGGQVSDSPTTRQTGTAAKAAEEYKNLQGKQEALEQALAGTGQDKTLSMRITDRGLVLGLVANDTYFGAEDATLKPAAQQILDAISPILRDSGDDIAVEGHANSLPTSRYKSNWQLSSERATSVLERLIMAGVPADKIRAVGYGDAHPAPPEEGQDPIIQNRRVDIVVLSRATEDVRQMLPQVKDTAVSPTLN